MTMHSNKKSYASNTHLTYSICTKKPSGFILVTGLILLVVIAVAAISSMEISNLDYKMASNTAFKDQSFQASETGRIATGDAVNQFIDERSWTSVAYNSGLSFDSTFNPLAQNANTENLFDMTSLNRDMRFSIAKSTTMANVDADIFIMRAPGVSSVAGMGTQQFSGYEGSGKGLAASGSAIYFELRSRGIGSGGAETVTASEYRTFIK